MPSPIYLPFPIKGSKDLRTTMDRVVRFLINHLNAFVPWKEPDGALIHSGLLESHIHQPTNDNLFSLGSASRRWTAVWAVNGTIQTSDPRLKKDIVDVGTQPMDVSAMLASARPVTWKWEEGDEETRVGWNADDWEAVGNAAGLSVVVVPEDGSPKGIRISEVVALLHQSLLDQSVVVKELLVLVESQGAEIQSQSLQINALERRLLKIENPATLTEPIDV